MNVDRFRGTDHEWDAFGSPMPGWTAFHHCGWRSLIESLYGLYWAFIERAGAGGLSRFNFGRCTPGSPTHRYKQQWGAKDEPLWWYQQSSQPEPGTPSQDSPHFVLATRVWRHLPVGVATALGGRIVRFLP